MLITPFPGPNASALYQGQHGPMPYLENMGLILADFNNQENLIKKIYIFLFKINSLEGSCRHSLSST
ncbi:MAG: hypothetical protein COA65_02090 [Rhodospirillaceae bacterium]|nr:MAG: hypothetical protein COA65_02090 [Rhodospirillaceae bacterium]